ncbi:hypothetical protein BH23BAC1_BH23BAC1_18020 [soil metagenome]
MENSAIPPHFLEKILNREDQVVFIYNKTSNKFEYVNSTFEIIWEREADSYKENPELLIETVVQDDQGYLLSKIEEVFAGKPETIIEFKIRTGNNKRKWIVLKILAYREEREENLIFGFAKDNTLRKEFELNMLDINERKNNVLQIVGHDLRGPLENLRIFTDLLEKEYDSQQFVDFKTYIKYMKQTCQNSINLISELLTLEYLQADRIDIKLSRLDFISRIKTIFETYKLADKDLTKKFILNSESEKIYIEVDELKFMLIFSNLISNAYKFTKDEGEITVTVKENEDFMLVCVADDGIGIPEKLQPHIFEKFTKARRPGLHGEKPVGLGLHIIKSMVEIHHGKIWFDSKEGEGTKFFVEIPKFLSNEMDKLAGIPDPTEL